MSRPPSTPGSSAWNRVRRKKDYEAGLEIISPYLDALYDQLNEQFFDGELVDVPLWSPDDTVPKFRVEAFSLEYRGLAGCTMDHGVIRLDWSVLTPTRVEPILIHEMVHVLGFKRGAAELAMHGGLFVEELRRLHNLGAGDWARAEAHRYKWQLDNPQKYQEILDDRDPRSTEVPRATPPLAPLKTSRAHFSACLAFTPCQSTARAPGSPHAEK